MSILDEVQMTSKVNLIWSVLIGNIEGLRRDDPELRRQVRRLWRKVGGARRRRPAAEDDEEGEESGSSDAGSDKEDEGEGEGEGNEDDMEIELTEGQVEGGARVRNCVSWGTFHATNPVAQGTGRIITSR